MASHADQPVFVYVECDGMVDLRERDGVLCFPQVGDVDDAALDYGGEMDFPEGKVLFAVPRAHHWPREWTFKDDVPGLPHVAPIVRRAINASLVREVVGALVFHPDDGPLGGGAPARGSLLLVKASRGFTKGMWNIPGGFVTYGETTEHAMTREMKEETGLDIRLERLLGVFTQKFSSPYYMRGHMFLARALTTDLALQEDEIADARWFDVAEARRVLLNPFGQRALDALDRGVGLVVESRE